MLQGIQCLRAVAALLVVTQHAIHCQQKYGRGELPLLSRFNFAFAVDMLFVVSGLMIVLVNGGRGGSWSSATTFLRKRLVRIVPNYWFYTTVFVVLALVVPQAFDRFRLDGAHALQSYLFFPAQNFEGKTLPVLVVGWTLEYEMYFYLVLAALLLLPPRWLLPALTAVFGSSVLLGVLCPPDSPPLRLMTSPVLLELLMGAWLGRLTLHGLSASRRSGLLLLAAGGGVLAFAGTLGDTTEWTRVLWFGLPSAAVVLGMLFLEQSGVRAFPRLLVRMGDTSYSLYLSHIIVLPAIGKAWKQLGLDAVCPDLALLATLLTVSLIVAEISYRMIEDPARRILSRRAPSGQHREGGEGQRQVDRAITRQAPSRRAA